MTENKFSNLVLPFNPKPVTRNSVLEHPQFKQPETRNPQPETAFIDTLSPCTPNPKPATRNSIHKHPSSKQPPTRNPQPETRNRVLRHPSDKQPSPNEKSTHNLHRWNNRNDAPAR